MKNIKCSDCAEYKNEWCEKIVDSPDPHMPRDCQYWHERVLPMYNLIDVYLEGYKKGMMDTEKLLKPFVKEGVLND